MLGTVLIVVLILMLVGALPLLVSQPTVGLLPKRRAGLDPAILVILLLSGRL